MAPAPALTTAYLNWVTLMQYPIIACEVLIFFEAVRVIPGEVRMLARIKNRKRMNIAEILFFLTKYLALLAVVADATTQLTSGWLNPTGCNALSWIFWMCLFFTQTTISTTLAWRCYVIYQRSRKVGFWLLLGLAAQCSLSMLTGASQLKFKLVRDGYCANAPADLAFIHSLKWYQKKGIYFLLYSVFFDSALVVFTCHRLIKCVRGPSGLQRIGKLLFVNNLHYLAIVSLLNLVEFFVMTFFANILPNLLPLTMVVEVMVGLQLLISEQDAAHGYGKTTVQTGYTGAPSGTGNRPSNGGLRNVTSTDWTDTKRTAATTATGTSFSSHHAGTTHSGLEGIRYDCTEEVLVDYDMTMTQLSPEGAIEPWDGGNTSTHPLTSEMPFEHTGNFDAKSLDANSLHSPDHRQGAESYGMTTTSSNNPYYQDNNAAGHPRSPQGTARSPLSGSHPNDNARGGGLSIKSIREGLNNQAQRKGEADSLRSHSELSIYPAVGSGGGGNGSYHHREEQNSDLAEFIRDGPTASRSATQKNAGNDRRVDLHRQGSVASAASACTCQVSPNNLPSGTSPGRTFYQQQQTPGGGAFGSPYDIEDVGRPITYGAALTSSTMASPRSNTSNGSRGIAITTTGDLAHQNNPAYQEYGGLNFGHNAEAPFIEYGNGQSPRLQDGQGGGSVARRQPSGASLGSHGGNAY